MEKYNRKLEENKYGILGLYIEKVKELQQGKIPIGFEEYSSALRKKLPYFPDEERTKYQEVLEAGLAQVNYLRAYEKVNALKDGEESRKKTIDDFLKEVDA